MRRQKHDPNTLIQEPHLFSLAELYHENSKLRWTNSRQYLEFISAVAGVPYIVEKMAHAYKSYSVASQISLPRLWDENGKSPEIEAVVARRRTARQFAGRSLTVEELSKLLHFSYGITGAAPISKTQDEYQYFRSAPSAGALYPLEIYLVLWGISDLAPGVYHYSVFNHALELLKPGDFARSVGEYTFSQDIAEKASTLFVISAMFQRTMFKYNERGYRFVLLDAGHVGQNVCLMATAMHLGVLPIGGFLDDELNRLLDIDGVLESVIYPLLVGALE
jgi:SagB-type dehydrogenase family enzyme